MPSLQSIVVKAHCGPTSRKVMNKGTQGGFQGKHAPYLAAVLAGNALASKIALADEALSVPEFSVPDVTGTALESSGISELFADNPLLIGGAALLVALPLGINAILKAGTEASGQVKPTSVENTYAALENDPRVILVDIRNRAEIKAQGSPDLRSVKRSAVSVPFTNVVKGEVEVNENFAAKFSTIKNISEESLVILFDADGSVAKTAAANISDMVAKAYYVQGGAETWAATGPWRAPSAGIKLPDLRSFGSSINNLAEDFKKAPTVGKAGIAAAAIAGAGVLIFNEAELVLEAVGALAGANFLFNLLLKEPVRAYEIIYVLHFYFYGNTIILPVALNGKKILAV